MFYYVASPYSSTISDVVLSRYDVLLDFMTQRLTDAPNDVLYSPILHCHDWASKRELPTDAETWRRLNLSMLQRASGLYILALLGWQDSKGVAMEMRFAHDLHLPITIWKWNSALEIFTGHAYSS